MGKISLVTGGAGFIGSHVVDALLTMGHEVIVLDDLSGGYRENIPKKSRFIEGSILDESLLDEIFNKNSVDYIFHLAAYAAEGLSHFIRKFNYENNLLGSVNLINRAVRFDIKHFVFTSSIAVYGANQTPMIELMTPMPEDPYGISKYAVELDLQAAHRMFNLPYTIFRPHNVYGERQNYADTYRNVIGIFINNILNGRSMTIFGDGKQRRAFSYISDVAPYIAHAIDTEQAKNEIINIGADTPYTVYDLAHIVAKYMGVEPDIEYLPPRMEVVDAFSQHTKAKQIFRIKTYTDLDTGIANMVTWCKKYGSRKTKKFGQIEIMKNMPPSWSKLT